MSDQSADISIDSTNAAVIKRAISAKISGATHFLCLIGGTTYASEWVKWEIEKAIELGKKIIAVKINKDCTSPQIILAAKAKWALSFTFDGITAAINGA